MKTTGPAIPKFAIQLEANEHLKHSRDDPVLASKKIHIHHADGSLTAVTLFLRVPAKDLARLRAENKVDSAEKTTAALAKFLKARGLSTVQINKVMDLMRKQGLADAKVTPMLRSMHERSVGMNREMSLEALPSAEAGSELRNPPSVKQKFRDFRERYFDAPQQISATLFSDSFDRAMSKGQMLRVTENTVDYLNANAPNAKLQASRQQSKKPLPVPPPRALKAGAGKPLPPTPQRKPAAPVAAGSTASTLPPDPDGRTVSDN